jgi:hypothetical protein
MIGLFESARQLQAFCDQQGWRSCFIGGIAVQRWGEPRVTLVVDLTLLTGFGGENPYLDALLAAYAARIGDARSFARQSRVLLLRTADGVGIDVSPGALPFEERVVSRAIFVWPRDRDPNLLGRGSASPETLRVAASRRTGCRRSGRAAPRPARLGIHRGSTAAAGRNQGGTGNPRDPGSPARTLDAKTCYHALAVECSKPGPDRALGSGVASLGLPQGIVKN